MSSLVEVRGGPLDGMVEDVAFFLFSLHYGPSGYYELDFPGVTVSWIGPDG